MAAMRTILASIAIVALLWLLVAGQSRAQDAPGLTCAPGDTIAITGAGPARTGLLLRFGGRAVGGGVSDAAGAYRLTLQVGGERPGDYPVVIEVRETRELLQQLTCTVPGTVPGATPRPAGTPAPTRPDETVSTTVTALRTTTTNLTSTATGTPAPTITTRPTITSLPTITAIPKPTFSADPLACAQEYPDFCIRPPPPDLDCTDIPYTNFTVLQPNDRHRFDANKNGRGCESSE